jgi:hypothetical protein
VKSRTAREISGTGAGLVWTGPLPARIPVYEAPSPLDDAGLLETAAFDTPGNILSDRTPRAGERCIVSPSSLPLSGRFYWHISCGPAK